MKIFELPDLGEGLPDAIIREWHVNVGDEIKVDQPLVSMETAKALVDVPSPYTGKVTTLHGKEGDTINTGEPLVSFDADAEESDTSDKGTVVGDLQEAEQQTSVPEAVSTVAQTHITAASGIRTTPAVRALAQRLDVDLASVTGTGANGMISAADVRAAADSQTQANNSPALNSIADEHFIELSAVKRAMAASMTLSHQQVVPVTIIDDADISAWDKSQNPTVRIIQAITAACAAEPVLNSHFDSASMRYRQFEEVNLGIAVDTPRGLYVPVIHNVQDKADEALRSELNDLKEQAKSHAIPADKLKNPTIMLSNFGAIAGRYANPIVVPPMVAIIGVGRAREEVCLKDGQLGNRRVMSICVSIDHRAVTGGEAARFLKVMCEHLAQPAL